MSPGSHDDDGKGEEPRVRDLLRESSPALDPSTVAQLKAWFGLPSFDDLAEAGHGPPEPTVYDQVLAQRAKATAEVKPELVFHLERHGRYVEDVAYEPLPERPWTTHRLLALDETRLPDQLEGREVEIPTQLLDDLKICTPQAFLRDLHRPEVEWYVQFQSPWSDDLEPQDPNPMGPIRSAMRASYRVGTLITPASRETTAALAEIKQIKRGVWSDAKRAPARAREAALLAEAEAAAAGKLGGPGAVPREPKDSP